MIVMTSMSDPSGCAFSTDGLNVDVESSDGESFLDYQSDAESHTSEVSTVSNDDVVKLFKQRKKNFENLQDELKIENDFIGE